MRDFGFYWRMIRPHTLSASIIPVLIGSTLALRYIEKFSISLAITMLIASVLIQIATNLFNEYFDYHSGTDTKDSIGNSGTIVRDGASPAYVLKFALSLYGISILLGVYICMKTTWWLAIIGALLMCLGYFYGGGPYPLSRSPFGEFFSGFAMGFCIILIAFYIQTGFVNSDAVLISLPFTLLIAQIMTSNNIRDRVNDQRAGRKTLAVLLGHRKSVIYMSIVFIIVYILSIVIVMMPMHHWPVLLTFLTVPLAIKSIQLFSREDLTPKQMMPAMAITAKTNKYYGITLTIGLLIEYFLYY